jgi:hypothetical protein
MPGAVRRRGVRPPAGPRRRAPDRQHGPGRDTAKISAPLAIVKNDFNVLGGLAGLRDGLGANEHGEVMGWLRAAD